MSMIRSVNVGRPRLRQWRGRTVSTAIFKEPVEGRVAVGAEGLDGDQQSDRNVHGGPDKAVYAYPVEHYEPWRAELGLDELPAGSFGENLTIAGGWSEAEVRIGDRFRIGGASFEVSEPRLPCAKLNLRFRRPDMIRRMLENGRFGFYLRVLEPGTVASGDPIERTARGEVALTVLDVARLSTTEKADAELLRRAVAAGALPLASREEFARRLAAIEAGA